MDPHIVIVGGVAAGPKMAAKARREDPDVPITLITDESVISYAACGTPYYLGGVVPRREQLLVRTADDFGKKNNVTMLTGHRVTAIDRQARTVEVTEVATGETQTIAWTKLGIATGASPFVPPLDNVGADGVFNLRSVTDAFAIADHIEQLGVRRTVVVGAGLIGLEVAEQFRERGLEVTVIELMPQVLPPVDKPVAHAVEQELERLGIRVMLGTRVEGIQVDGQGRAIGVTTDHGDVPADLVLLSIGVRPNVQLARDAGLELGVTGAIKVDEQMRTSDPDIFAAGDCAEQTHLVTGTPCWIPLGSTANKQARVAAVNMTGGRDRFPGVVGSALVRVGKLNVGRTGLGVREMERAELDYEAVIVPQMDRPGYMPGAGEVTLVLYADRATRRVLGGQAFGPGQVDKRIDILATAITGEMTVDQVANLDLGYAPPFAPALDVVITAANVIRNKLDERTHGVMPDKLELEGQGEAPVLLDCRELAEWNDGRLPRAVHIPLGDLDERAGEVDGDREVIVYCKGGLRSAEGYRKLKRKGHRKVRYLDGGMTSWVGPVER